jgi:cobalamin biosynthesis Mg chelatase CobN
MAYKRKTTKTGANSRRSTTYNTNGPTTHSNSTSVNRMTTTYTTKGAKSYITQTTRRADGYVERKRVASINSAPRKKSRKSSGSGIPVIDSIVVIMFVLFLIGSVLF